MRWWRFSWKIIYRVNRWKSDNAPSSSFLRFLLKNDHLGLKWKFCNFSECSLNLSVHLLIELNPLTRYVESPFAVQSIFIFEVVNEFMAEIRGLTFILNAKNQNHFIFSPIIRCNHHQNWGRFVNPCYMISKNTLIIFLKL